MGHPIQADKILPKPSEQAGPIHLRQPKHVCKAESTILQEQHCKVIESFKGHQYDEPSFKLSVRSSHPIDPFICSAKADSGGVSQFFDCNRNHLADLL